MYLVMGVIACMSLIETREFGTRWISREVDSRQCQRCKKALLLLVLINVLLKIQTAEVERTLGLCTEEEEDEGRKKGVGLGSKWLVKDFARFRQ